MKRSGRDGNSQRPGTFQKGHEKVGGRKTGTPNKFTESLRELIRETMRLEGMDGKGTDEELGFLRNAARKQLGVFLHSLVRPLVSLQPTTEPEKNIIVYKGEAEYRQAMRDTGVHPSLLPPLPRDPDEKPPANDAALPPNPPDGYEWVLHKTNRTAETGQEQPDSSETESDLKAEEQNDGTETSSYFPKRRRLKKL